MPGSLRGRGYASRGGSLTASPTEIALTALSVVVRRSAAILLLGPALDANYEAVKADTWPWPGRMA